MEEDFEGMQCKVGCLGNGDHFLGIRGSVAREYALEIVEKEKHLFILHPPDGWLLLAPMTSKKKAIEFAIAMPDFLRRRNPDNGVIES
jgi:hypothetical protein